MGINPFYKQAGKIYKYSAIFLFLVGVVMIAFDTVFTGYSTTKHGPLYKGYLNGFSVMFFSIVIAFMYLLIFRNKEKR